MKKPEWDSPWKMHFESDFKTFNKQTSIISTGNVVAPTQYSSFIRPYSEVKNGAYIGKPGDFLRYDMQFFRNVPEYMQKILKDTSRKESYILYEFSVVIDGSREIIGHVLTDYNYHLAAPAAIHCAYGKSWWKRASAVYECIKYITDEEEKTA